MLKDDLLKGAKSAAEYLGLDIRTIYQMTENGSLPAIRKGRMLFFRRSELDAAFSSEVAA